MDVATPSEDRDHLPFGRHHAFIIGIDAYEKVSRLKTAVNDARRLADVLSGQQHFLVHPPLLNATGGEIRALLRTTLREQVKKDDRVFFYFAGHGIAADGDDGPAGYIVPADADPTDAKTFIAMSDLQQALDALPCRHLLLVLDCCFSGAFKWSSQYRAIGSLMPKRIYKERFDRFIQDPAWQVITSAAYDQKALDVLDGKATGDRGIATSDGNGAHSPFAQALFSALAGAADVKGERESDGMITATELYAYIRDQVEPQTIEAGQRLRQTPGFFPLKKHDKGEFIFLHPRHRLNLPPTPKHSPYKGLASFDEEDRLLFYGRDRVIKELREKARSNKLIVISGASGTGKSSVVKAGLLPVLRAEGFRILPVIRPGAHPMAALDQALKEAQASPAAGSEAPAAGAGKAILLIDQFEEVITRCADPNERQQLDARLRRLLDEDRNIHRIILTVRSDFEPQLNSGELRDYWMAGRCTAPPFSLEELKEVIVMPTIQEVLIFDPPSLVDDIIEEVAQSPGALPLLSYALNELYEAYRASGRQDRALRKDDYDKLGGVMGALRTKADTLYKELPADERNTMRKIMLRMVSVEGDLASKRAPMDDLFYSDAEKPLVNKVVEKLVDARLIVRGQDYIEPAHDALVRAWKTLHEWIHEAKKEKLILGAKLNAAANEFAQSKNSEFLWNNNPNLPVVKSELTNKRQWFNAKEIDFVKKSVARKKRRARIGWGIAAVIGVSLLALAIWAWVERGRALDETRKAEAQRLEAEAQKREAEAERARALRSLFSSLNVNMIAGQPGSVCAHPSCAKAPAGDGGDWIPISRLPQDLQSFEVPIEGRIERGLVVREVPEREESRDFIVARQYAAGHVLVYAHDGLTMDEEIKTGSDNLLFAENALRWLAPSRARAGCPDRTSILLWQGTYVQESHLVNVREFIQRRDWKFVVAEPETLEADLRCAGILWYLSDWRPPADFASRHVPLIERFVRDGGGLLVGGLGWSYAQQGPRQPYAANELGKPFGFAFTADAFEGDRGKPIRLLAGADP